MCHFHYPDRGGDTRQGAGTSLFYPRQQSSLSSDRKSDDPPDRKTPELDSVIPESSRRPYDMKKIIVPTLDDKKFFEVHAHYARNLITGFGRLNGKTIGIVANQPNWLAGCLDTEASVKCARFVRFCDSFNIPLWTLLDVPGYLPGTQQEHGGIIKHGAKKIGRLRRSHCAKGYSHNQKGLWGRLCRHVQQTFASGINLAYPTAEIAVMGPEGAIQILFRKEIEEAPILRRGGAN